VAVEVAVAVTVAVGVAVWVVVAVAVADAVRVAVAVAEAVPVAVAVFVAVAVTVAVALGVAVRVAVDVDVAVGVAVLVAVTVAVAVRVAVAVAEAVPVAVAVFVAVTVTVADAVGVAVRVAVDVAVAVWVVVAVAVAVGVEVAVAVGVGVGFFFFFADPVSLTLADGLPAVASLLIAMLPEKLPLSVGANPTVTVASPCGAISVVPCPDKIVKKPLPVGEPTVTERALEPSSLIVKDFFSAADPGISGAKSSTLFDNLSLLTDALRLAPTPLSCARAPAANEIVQAISNDAAAAMRSATFTDANRNPPPTLVTNPPCFRMLAGPFTAT
jgi:hypothetical protein